jgi:hypothetical protein
MFIHGNFYKTYNILMEWKWAKGGTYEKSKRHIAKKEELTGQIDLDQLNKDHQLGAYTSSLNYDENTWDILNQSVSQNGFQNSNSREELDSKISNRSLVQQVGTNPFFDEKDYVDNVSIRDQYMKPINTTTVQTTSVTSQVNT